MAIFEGSKLPGEIANGNRTGRAEMQVLSNSHQHQGHLFRANELECEGNSKILISLVRPGVLETLAVFEPNNALIMLDLPTLDLPTKLTPMISRCSASHVSNCAISEIPILNWALCGRIV